MGGTQSMTSASEMQFCGKCSELCGKSFCNFSLDLFCLLYRVRLSFQDMSRLRTFVIIAGLLFTLWVATTILMFSFEWLML